MAIEVDILEDYIYNISPELLTTLLKDHTTSREGEPQRNIFWATSDYEHLGEDYGYHSPILPHLVTGTNGHVIIPRVLKSRDTQTARSRDMAEVFTPSWICNAQNNLIDEAWFGRKEVFNVEQKIFLQLQSNYVLLRMKIKEQIIVILTIKLLLVFSPFCVFLNNSAFCSSCALKGGLLWYL